MSKTSLQSRLDDLLAHAKARKAKAKYWTDLHNAVFGVGGKFGQLFATHADRARALKSDEVAEIRRLIESLPEAPASDANRADASGKILIRVPKSVHAALLSEAASEATSLNQLILTKLSMQLRSLA